jgi:hypothetical protein
MTTYSHLGHQQTDGCGFKARAINTDTDVRFATDGSDSPRGLYFSFSLCLSLFRACVAPGYASTRQPRCASRAHTGQSRTKIWQQMNVFLRDWNKSRKMYSNDEAYFPNVVFAVLHALLTFILIYCKPKPIVVFVFN